MAATVQIEQITGASPGTYTYKDNSGIAKSGTRYMTSDQWDGSLTSYPIPIPTKYNGYSGSYWVTHCINVVSAPSTYIKDLRYYQTWSTSPKVDWSLGDSNACSPDVYIGISSSTISDARTKTNGFPSSQYQQATGVEGAFGYLISSATHGHSYYINAANPVSGGMVSITNFNSPDNAYMVQAGNVVGASTGRSYCIVTQVIVGSGATQGEKADKTATFVYSEA